MSNHNRHTQRTSVASASFSGPIPPPSLLASYDALQSGLADRIVSMAEKEQNSRHDIDARQLNLAEVALKARIKLDTRRQWLSFIVVFGLFGLFSWMYATNGKIENLIALGTLFSALLGIKIFKKDEN